MNTNSFKAPWGRTLRWVSLFASLVIVSPMVPLFWKIKPEALRWMMALPALILAGAALFIIRSYSIQPNGLAIRRLLWTTQLSLSGLQSAELMPGVMRSSLRLFGNGGLFSITGWYRNRALGSYRAFVTDLTKTVVLRFPTRTVVVSPANPEQFISEVSQFTFPTS